METLHVLRFEGPPESGKTAEAQRWFRTAKLMVPTTPEDSGTEDVSILPIREFFRDPTPGRPFSPAAAEECIELALHALTDSVHPRALLVTRTRDVFTVAGEHSAHVLDYLYRAVKGAGLQFLAFEDSMPAPSLDDAPARKQWESLPWLVGAEAKTMPPATTFNIGSMVQDMVWSNRQLRVFTPYTATFYATQLGSFRFGVVQRLVDAAARVSLAENEKSKKARIVTLAAKEYEAGAGALLLERSREHSLMLRGPLSRTEESLHLATCVAKFSKDGVPPLGKDVREYVSQRLGREVVTGALHHAAKMLVRDGVLWLSGTGHAYLSDALLATRLTNPELAAKVDQQTLARETERSVRASMLHL